MTDQAGVAEFKSPIDINDLFTTPDNTAARVGGSNVADTNTNAVTAPRINSAIFS